MMEMEVFLVNNQAEDENRTEVIDITDEYVEKVWERIPMILEPVEDSIEGTLVVEAIKKLLYETKLKDIPDLEPSRKYNFPMDVNFFIPTSTSEFGKVEFGDDPMSDGNIFCRLVEAFKRQNLMFSLTMKGMSVKFSCGCAELINLEIKDAKIPIWKECHVFKMMKFPEHGSHPEATLEGTQFSYASLTVTMKLNERAMGMLPLKSRGLPLHHVALKNKTLLEEEIGSDIVIVAANGGEIKAHKSMLMVSSDAFRAMFEHETKERASSRLEMTDFSEDGIHALLKFAYWGDMTAALDNCDIALELFRAGDKYQMLSLRAATKKLILSKEAKWFNVNMAVSLSIQSRNFADKEEILKKVAQVLKWYNKNKYSELLASEDYQELFTANPKLAMQLFSHFLEFV